MVAALKKIVPDDFKGRFSAWWDGREYTPKAQHDAVPDHDNDTTDAAEASEPDDVASEPEPKPKKKPGVVPLSADASRIAALETLWGEGRFMPGSAELYNRITEGMSTLDGGSDAKFGILNGDPALTNHFMGTTGVCPVIAEWRGPCADRFANAFPDFDVVRSDVDRPGFEPGSLSLVVSQDGFAFSDHKSGLAVRILRSLKPGGQWVVIDTVRGKAKGHLSPAFATSWAEPQLCQSDEIEEICESAGFEATSGADDISGDQMQACRSSFERFGQHLDGKLAQTLEGVNKSVFVRELAWEAEAWKWRQRALAGELIHAKVWKFRKPAS